MIQRDNIYGDKEDAYSQQTAKRVSMLILMNTSVCVLETVKVNS
jgi:hypothetical protein